MADGKVHLKGGKVLLVGGKVALADDCCCGVPCENCAGSRGPKEYLASFSGIVAGTVPCTECPDLDGSYVAVESAACIPGGGLPPGTCGWQWLASSSIILCPPSGDWWQAVCVTAKQVGAIYRVGVNFYIWANGLWTNAIFSKDYADLPDCRNFAGEDIPFVTQSGISWVYCDFSSATCTLTAL